MDFNQKKKKEKTMKKILSFIAIIALAGCGSVTVKNEYSEDIKIGSTDVPAGQCVEVSGGWFGEFPATITKKDDSAIGSNEVTKEWEEAHYLITAEGEISEQTEEPKCEDPAETTGTNKHAGTPETKTERPTENPAPTAPGGTGGMGHGGL